MKKKHRTKLASFLIAKLLCITLLISSCGKGQLISSTSTPAPKPTATLIPTVTSIPTKTPEEIILDAVRTACQSKPAALPDIGVSSAGVAGVRLCPDVGDYSLLKEWIADTPGNLRFVVDVQKGKRELPTNCGPYSKTDILGQPLADTSEISVRKFQQFIDINLINAQTGEVVDHTRIVSPETECPYQIQYFPDSDNSVIGDPVSAQAFQDAVFALLSPSSTRSRTLISDGPNHSLGFSPDRKLLVTVSDGGRDLLGKNVMTVWDLASHRILRTVEDVDLTAFSPDGTLLATLSYHGSMKLLDMASMSEVRALTLEEIGDWVAFSPDGTLLAILSYENKTVKLWEVASGREVSTVEFQFPDTYSNFWPHHVALSPDLTMLVSSSSQDHNKVRLWDVTTGREVRTLGGNNEWVLNIAFSPDSKLLAVNTGDAVILRDLASGQLALTPKDVNTRSSMTFSPDGLFLAITDDNDDTVKVWEIANGQLALILKDVGSRGSITFSPDGKLLATFDEDSNVDLWNIELP